MKTITNITTLSEEERVFFEKVERENINKFQEALDYYANLSAYIPTSYDLGNDGDWIDDESTFIILNVRVAIHVDNIAAARQYLWDCCGWATILNTEGKGIKIGNLPSGQQLFCSRFYDENENLINA